MTIQLLDLPEDVLLTTFQHLQIGSILSIRQTCRRLNDLSRYRSVWKSAYNRFVKHKGVPFPYKDTEVDDLDTSELERWTRHALALGSAWRSPGRHARPDRTLSFPGGPLNGLQSMHFMLRRDQEWIITLSDGIWPAVICWDLRRVQNQAPMRCGEWSCRGTNTVDLAVDPNITNDPCLAVAVDNYSASRRYIEIQVIKPVLGSHEVVFETLKVIDTDERPVLLDGDILVTSDDYSETRVLDWRTGAFAILKASEEPDEVIQHNKCHQVLFAHESIFIARSRSIDVFPAVTLPPEPSDQPPKIIHPVQSCPSGWIDGVAISPLYVKLPVFDADFNIISSLDDEDEEKSVYPYPPIAILIRESQGNPWASTIHSVNFFTVYPNPAYASDKGLRADTVMDKNTDNDSHPSPQPLPYVFPPIPTPPIPARRDFMRCPTLALGPCGTSLWVSAGENGTQKQSQELESMLWSEASLKSILCGGEMWTCMAYNESWGCIALGAVDGTVKVLYMV